MTYEIKWYKESGKRFRNRALIRLYKYRKESTYQLGVGFHNYAVVEMRGYMIEPEEHELNDLVDSMLSTDPNNMDKLAEELVNRDPLFAQAFSYYLSFYGQDAENQDE